MSDSDSDTEPAPVVVNSDSSDSYEDEVPQDVKREDKETLVERHTSVLDSDKDTRSMDSDNKISVHPPESVDAMAAQQRPLPRRKRFIPHYEVEGVHRITIGEETQINIEIMIGTDVNAQYPWKTVSKAKILENIETYCESSELFPFKEVIEAFDGDEILMGYIVDESSDVDEFYICCTKEARDHCKQQSDKFIRRQEKKLEKAVQKKPRPWKSLGSEKEIIELVPVNTRPLIELEVKSKFPKLYEPEKFFTRDTTCVRDGFIELTPYRQKFNNVFRRRIDKASQATPAKTDRDAQTVLRYPKNMWTQSIADALGKVGDTDAGGDAGREAEGGGGDVKQEAVSDDDDDKPPKEEPDEVGLAPYKAAMNRMRRPSYIKSINSFVGSQNAEMNALVELNTVMDFYCNDYPKLVSEKSVDSYDSMSFEEYVCFTDVRAKDKYVSSAVFHPMWSGIVAISYADGSPSVMKYLSSKPDPIQRAVYGLNPVLIWSHIDSLMPKLYLESPREVKVLSFCPFDENILVGGLINGQIVLWDLTKKLENVEKMEVLSETREKYRIAMNAHMGWMKNVEDKAVVAATALSNLMTSHYGPVSSIKWLSPNFVVSSTGKPTMAPDQNKSMMLFSGSEDGNILIWNLSIQNVTAVEGKKVKKSKRVPIRPAGLLLDLSPFKVLDRNFQPCYKLILGVAGQPATIPLQSFDLDSPAMEYKYTPKNSRTGRKYFTCKIKSQTEDQLSTIMYCGSMHGETTQVSWEGHDFNTGEVVNSEYCALNFRCFIHDGIVTATKKNPFINSIALSVGGKILAIWSDKLKFKPLTWKKREHRLTDAAWSMYKPSLFFVTTSDGTIETWDLLHRSDQPISVQTLSGSTLTGVSLHTLPLVKNIIGVSDINGSFKMFLDPSIFMIENRSYTNRIERLIERELKVTHTFTKWQAEWMKQNPHILLEIKRKEGALLAEKEEEKRKEREQEEKRIEEEAELRRLAKLRVIGPEERWQQLIQKLIERTIAVKKRINRAELFEQERPLRELETQRLEKERRMLEIMKNQKEIFKDTVAILFPEAIKKPEKPKKSLLTDNKEILKKDYMDDYAYIKQTANKTVKEHPYKTDFSWDATLAEGKERRQALHAYEDFIRIHKTRLEVEGVESHSPTITPDKNISQDAIDEETAEENKDIISE